MKTSFYNFTEKLGPFETNPTIAIALSGGIDSMVLLQLASEWIKIKNGKIIAITIDHGLRSNSSEEAYNINKLLKNQSIEHNIIKWSYNIKPDSNIQAKARDARYKLLTDYCLKNNIIHLFTAHHRDDQAETFFMRLSRGSGIDGLSGISPIIIKNNIRILRPLIHFTKAEIREYAIDNHIQWFEDPSNQNEKYKRNFVRKFLEANNLKSLVDSAYNIARARISIDKLIAENTIDIVEISPLGYGYIDLIKFKDLDEEEALKILSQSLITIRGSKSAIRMDSLYNLYSLIKNESLPSSVTLNGCMITNQHNKLLIYREKKEKNFSVKYNGNEILFDDRFLFRILSNLNIDELEFDYVSQNHMKIIGNIKTNIPKKILYGLPLVKKNGEIISIFSIQLENFTEIECYFKPYFPLVKNKFYNLK